MKCVGLERQRLLGQMHHLVDKVKHEPKFKRESSAVMVEGAGLFELLALKENDFRA